MKGGVVFSLVLLSVLKIDRATCSAKCGDEEQSPEALKLSILSKRNKMGKWVTEFRAYKDDTEIDLDNDIGVEVKQDFVLCDGRRKVTIQGKITGQNELELNETTKVDAEIRFHHLTGSNAVLFDKGRTVEKRTLTTKGYGSAFSNRPLKDNELFEVILEKKTNHFQYSLAVGLSTLSPENMIIPEFMNEIPSPNWSMYYDVLYDKEDVLRRGYGKSLDTLREITTQQPVNLYGVTCDCAEVRNFHGGKTIIPVKDNNFSSVEISHFIVIFIQVGDRVGVMRRSNGDFHVFINGEDQGVAVSKVPSQVYGVIELYANAARATIVKRS